MSLLGTLAHILIPQPAYRWVRQFGFSTPSHIRSNEYVSCRITACYRQVKIHLSDPPHLEADKQV
jgi:hypothetical protein